MDDIYIEIEEESGEKVWTTKIKKVSIHHVRQQIARGSFIKQVTNSNLISLSIYINLLIFFSSLSFNSNSNSIINYIEEKQYK